MKLSQSHFTLGLWAAAVATLAACGGGGGGTDATNGGKAVTGIAATGLAIANGSVTLKCTTGTTAAKSTLTDGSFSIDVSGVTLPCVARVEYKDATGAAQQLHSLVSSTGNVNITPVTDMLVAGLSNGAAADAFDQFDAAKVKSYTKERISTETANVKRELTLLGVDPTNLSDDLIGSKFRPTVGSQKGDDQDDVLDKLKLKLNGKNLTEVETENYAGQSKGFATSTGAKTNSVAGQSLYAANCASCHGARISDATNYQNTLNAIAKNKGGMGILSASIKTAQADDIASYLVYGAGTPTTPVLLAQNISFTAPGNQQMGVATLALVASSDAKLTVTIASSTPTVCTVTNMALTLMGAGSCTLTATQAGSSTVASATPVIYTFAVAAAAATVALPTPQTITLTAPGNQTMGVAPAALVATSTSGLAVTLASSTASVCTVNGAALTLVAAGTCTITASQAGNASVAAAAPATSSFTVASAAAAGAAAGKVAYNTNTGTFSCASCHGLPGSQAGSRLLLAGATPSMIPNAITNGTGGMGLLANKYTAQQLADIAAYLTTPNL